MAEGAIFAALKVLGDVSAGELAKIAIAESSIFANLKASMDRTCSELNMVRGFLKDIDNSYERNNAQASWIKEVQRLAYHIEDLIVEFEKLVGNEKIGVKSFYLKQMLTNPKALLSLKHIGIKLLEAEKKIKHIREANVWVTNTNTGTTGNISNYYNDYLQSTVASSEFIDEDNIVGFKKIRIDLSNMLKNEESKITVTSVYGMGGVGKTTLATQVLKREKEDFDLHALISISQNYTIKNILRELISEICKAKQDNKISTADMNLRELKKTLSDLLNEKRYLIILDDVWEPKSFQDIKDALMSGHSQSHIVITTRMVEVASLASENNKLEVKPLPENESWNLFCRKAFHLERNYECPPSLENWARAIATKCDGLPLALVSLGGMLSLSEKTEFRWKCVYDQLSWQLDNNPSLSPIRNILNLSFSNLPRYLKNCFLYCGLFPEDFLYKRKKLIRLWVAEGFIEQKGRSTLEEVAEGYLNELIHRSMLQVVEKNSWGRVRSCRMHVIVRNLAISQCKIENFGFVHGDDEPTLVDTFSRRLSIIKLKNETKDYGSPAKLRTFLSFDPAVHSSPILHSVFSMCKYLSVLELCGMPIEKVSDGIGNFFNLHYLGLRETKVKFLPKSIKKLHNLQTLDLAYSKIKKLPDSITYLKKLRHLIADVVIDESHSSFRSYTGITLPCGMRHLKDLRTLWTVESNAKAIEEIGYLTQLRTLRIWNVKKNYWEDLRLSLSKMPFLSTLSIGTSQESEFLHLEGINPPPTQLRKLFLKGRLSEENLRSPLFQTLGKNVQELFLGWSQMRTDPVPYISHMDNLTSLHLQKAYEGQRLVFNSGWFPKLKFLSLDQMPNLVQVDIEQGTMVHLEEIEFIKLEQLAEIPAGIRHLTSLKRMSWSEMPAYVGELSRGAHQLHHFTCYVD